MEKYFKHIAIAIVAVVVIGAGAFFAMQDSGEYIEGNVLNIDISTNMYKGLIAMPWAINSVTSNLFYRSLFKPDYTLLNVSPDLASYELKEDGLTYVITLDENNLWSDGTPISMQDVIWSIETVQKIARPHYFYPTTFKNIETMDVDGNVLTIKLKEKSTLFIRVLAQLIILPQHALSTYSIEEMPTSAFWAEPVTSGFYRYDKTVEGEYLSFVINENYPKKKPQIEEVRLALDTSKVKVDFYFSNSNILEIMNFRAMRGFTEYAVNMNFFRYWVFNIEGKDGNKNPAMADIRVRQAICMGVNREALLRDIYLGMGNISDGKGTIGEFGPYNYNPERAKELLAESDYDLSRPLRITYYYRDETSQEFLQQVKKQLEAIGFIVALEIVQHPDYLYVERPYDVMLKGFGGIQRTEWFEEYASTYMLNALNGGKGELDELLIELRGEHDEKRYEELLNELAERELELLYKFPLFTLKQGVYINTERINVPNTYNAGNIFYAYDMKFEDWSIKKR